MDIYKSLMSGVLTVGFCLAFQAETKADGKIVIDSKIYSGTEYSSNFWKAEKESVAVSTYFVKPGLVFGYETPKTKINTDLSMDAYGYEDQETRPPGVRDPSDDNYIGFTGSVLAEHQMTDRLKIGLDDSLLVTRDPASSDAASDSVSREKFTINRFTPGFVYDFGKKSSTVFKYRNTATQYTEDLGGEDSSENRGLFDLIYNLNKSAAVFLNYQVWTREYDATTSAYTSHKVTLNYAHTINFLTFTGEAGYHTRAFDKNACEDIDMFTWNLSAKGEEKKSGERKSRYSVVAMLGQALNDEGTGEEYFITTTAKLSGSYLFLGKIGTGARFEFQNNEYQNDSGKREDDNITAAGKISYEIFDYLSLSIEGGIKQRDSNIGDKNYDEEFVIAILDFDYNFGRKQQ